MDKNSLSYKNCSLHILARVLYNVTNGVTIMEIIKIKPNAIKIILDESECLKYDFIKKDEISDEELLSSVDSLLYEIRKKEKIDLSVKKLLIQVYPLTNFGCEIYICDTEEENMYKDKSGQINIRKGITYKGVYRFDSLDGLLSVCKRIAEITDDDGAQAYYDRESGSYYLICRNISPKEMRFAFINEYARQLKSSYSHYVMEHLTCFCGVNAIKILSNLI